MKTTTAIMLMALTTQAYAGKTCTIVTNGTHEIFIHELAHCNSWRHEPFDTTTYPPPQYVHAYAGRLIVIMSQRDDRATRNDRTHIKAEISVSGKSVATLCATLWERRGISPEMYTRYLAGIIGCSVEN